jgi:hypothetical protein
MYDAGSGRASVTVVHVTRSIEEFRLLQPLLCERTLARGVLPAQPDSDIRRSTSPSECMPFEARLWYTGPPGDMEGMGIAVEGTHSGGVTRAEGLLTNNSHDAAAAPVPAKQVTAPVARIELQGCGRMQPSSGASAGASGDSGSLAAAGGLLDSRDLGNAASPLPLWVGRTVPPRPPRLHIAANWFVTFGAGFWLMVRSVLLWPSLLSQQCLPHCRFIAQWFNAVARCDAW